jgi:hypothetical protein
MRANRNETELCARDEWLWNFTLISVDFHSTIFIVGAMSQWIPSLNYMQGVATKNFKISLKISQNAS